MNRPVLIRPPPVLIRPALLAMRRSQGKWLGQDDELDAWFSDAHGVAEIATVLVQSQGGIKEEPGRHPAHDKVGKQMCHGVLAPIRTEGSSWVCTPPRAGVGKALPECVVYDIGEDSAQSCGGLGAVGGASTKRDVMYERPCDLIGKTFKDDDGVLPEGVDVGIVDAMAWALPRPPGGDNVSSGERGCMFVVSYGQLCGVRRRSITIAVIQHAL